MMITKFKFDKKIIDSLKKITSNSEVFFLSSKNNILTLKTQDSIYNLELVLDSEFAADFEDICLDCKQFFDFIKSYPYSDLSCAIKESVFLVGNKEKDLILNFNTIKQKYNEITHSPQLNFNVDSNSISSIKKINSIYEKTSESGSYYSSAGNLWYVISSNLMVSIFSLGTCSNDFTFSIPKTVNNILPSDSFKLYYGKNSIQIIEDNFKLTSLLNLNNFDSSLLDIAQTKPSYQFKINRKDLIQNFKMLNSICKDSLVNLNFKDGTLYLIGLDSKKGSAKVGVAVDEIIVLNAYYSFDLFSKLLNTSKSDSVNFSLIDINGNIILKITEDEIEHYLFPVLPTGV